MSGRTPRTRQEAQREADRLAAIRDELHTLERDGVVTLTPDQWSALDAHIDRSLASFQERFDIDTTESERRLSWGMKIASTLGGFALCAAVVLLFLRFWGLLGTPAQVAILAAIPLAALAGAEFAARRERAGYFTGLLSLVALAAFVLNLEALGRIFNLAPTPRAFLAWSAFALALAYAYGLRILLALGIGGLFCYLSATLSSIIGYHWFSFGDKAEDFAAAGFAVFFVPLLAVHRRWDDFPLVYRVVGAVSFFLAVLFLTLSGHSSYLDWDRESVERISELVLILASMGAIALGIRNQWEDTVAIGAAFFALELYIRLFRWLWDDIPKWLFFALVGALGIALVLVFRKLRARPERAVAA